LQQSHKDSLEKSSLDLSRFAAPPAQPSQFSSSGPPESPNDDWISSRALLRRSLTWRKYFCGACANDCADRGERCWVQHMTDKKITEEVDAIPKPSWDAGRRIAMQIAALPLEHRELSLQLAEKAFRGAAEQRGGTPKSYDAFVKAQMDLIRSVLKDIEVSGSPQGGRA
jgi:hypothetical protein